MVRYLSSVSDGAFSKSIGLGRSNQGSVITLIDQLQFECPAEFAVHMIPSYSATSYKEFL